MHDDHSIVPFLSNPAAVVKHLQLCFSDFEFLKLRQLDDLFCPKETRHFFKARSYWFVIAVALSVLLSINWSIWMLSLLLSDINQWRATRSWSAQNGKEKWTQSDRHCSQRFSYANNKRKGKRTTIKLQENFRFAVFFSSRVLFHVLQIRPPGPHYFCVSATLSL